jgi:hypothetical protein
LVNALEAYAALRLRRSAAARPNATPITANGDDDDEEDDNDDEAGDVEQPLSVMVVVVVAGGAAPFPPDVFSSAGGGSPPAPTAASLHWVVHFCAAQFASAFRFVFVLQYSSLSPDFKHE